ncbi:uncharacterized protein [Bemisia tabaci]|uniref:uncharacterized protein isoform X1 n=1 Tax=Bemisia tabaci TaxID=7038 RepID=UPI003B27F76C
MVGRGGDEEGRRLREDLLHERGRREGVQGPRRHRQRGHGADDVESGGVPAHPDHQESGELQDELSRGLLAHANHPDHRAVIQESSVTQGSPVTRLRGCRDQAVQAPLPPPPRPRSCMFSRHRLPVPVGFWIWKLCFGKYEPCAESPYLDPLCLLPSPSTTPSPHGQLRFPKSLRRLPPEPLEPCCTIPFTKPFQDLFEIASLNICPQFDAIRSMNVNPPVRCVQTYERPSCRVDQGLSESRVTDFVYPRRPTLRPSRGLHRRSRLKSKSLYSRIVGRDTKTRATADQSNARRVYCRSAGRLLKLIDKAVDKDDKRDLEGSD